MNQQLFANTYCYNQIKAVTMKITVLQKDAMMCYHQINIFLSAKISVTQRRTLLVLGECVVHTAVCQKAPLGPK